MRSRTTFSPPFLNIYFSDRLPFKVRREHKDSLSLIRRLVALPSVGIAALNPKDVSLEALTGGRSAAQVFKLTPLFGAARPGSHRQVKGTPVVVKIAPRTEALHEKANYEKFVCAGLPADCRPALLGFAQTRTRAALCYEFVGGCDGGGLETLTDHLQRGDGAALDLVLRQIFVPLQRSWYSPARIRRESNIARRYLDRYFAGKSRAAKHEAALRGCVERYFGARREDGGTRIGALWFPSPDAVLFASRRKRPYHSCILHGDLNTDNIVVSRPDRRRGPGTGRVPASVRASPRALARDNARVTLIDFLKTGRGHVYQDLASLEASIRINHPADASYAEIVEIERRIALGQRVRRGDPLSDNPYAESIRKIRAAAFRTFGAVEDESTYHFAVAALGLRLMQATDLSDIARARITISALWAAKMLAEAEAE